MRKTLSLVGTLTLSALALTACGAGGNDAGGESEADGHVVVGASPAPHGEILEFVAENLAADAGLEIEIVTYDDYVLPNSALNEGDIDANYFQHVPYLEAQIEEFGYDFDHFPGIHIEPLGIYSEALADLADLPQGATIGITNDPSNQARALGLLVQAELITLSADDPGAAQLSDVDGNDLGLEFIEADPASLVRTLPDVDAAIINGNFALEGGLNPAEDALLLESGEDNPYANILAVRAADVANEDLVTLNELLHSDEVRDFISERWPAGEVIPAF